MGSGGRGRARLGGGGSWIGWRGLGGIAWCCGCGLRILWVSSPRRVESSRVGVYVGKAVGMVVHVSLHLGE